MPVTPTSKMSKNSKDEDIEAFFNKKAPKEVATKSTAPPKKWNPRTLNPSVSHADYAQSLRDSRKWVDAHVLPILSWIAWVGVGIVGVNTILNHINTGANTHLDAGLRNLITIFIVAFLAFKAP